MPIVANTYLTTRKANTIMSAAFFPRAKEWLFPKVCGTYLTTSLDGDPHVIGGSAPQMKRYRGKVSSAGMPSWKFQVPNPLAKNYMEIDRSEIEGDQTRTLLRKADEFGVALADYPEQLWTARLLNGDQVASATDSFNGTTYTVTMDGLPQFSASHQLDGVTSQSNIITGSLPQSTTVLYDSDIALMANYMQRDLMKVVATIKTVKNDKGLPIYPTLDIKKNIVVLLPSTLEVVGRRAFSPGLVGGSPGNNGSTGSSDNIAPMFVSDVLSSGYLDGLPDPEGTTTLAPTYATTYYILVVNDRVKPFYVQNYKPVGENELFPKGYDVDAAIAQGLSEAKQIGLEGTPAKVAAATFASTLVEHNLTAVGANAQKSVVEDESHFISARSRMNIVYGPWFTCWQVTPGSTSGG